ncbi:hypothetical protein BDR06DRAFT_963099 [Suillus hirtellus]|nr:hypothetical protein BDR06DRAFT_963099 [Suillus hirtellus]
MILGIPIVQHQSRLHQSATLHEGFNELGHHADILFFILNLATAQGFSNVAKREYSRFLGPVEHVLRLYLLSSYRPFVHVCSGDSIFPVQKAYFIPEDAPSGWKHEPLPMYAHTTCTGEIDVALNCTLIEYIIDTLPIDNYGTLVTLFDVSIYSNLMRSRQDEDFAALW